MDPIGSALSLIWGVVVIRFHKEIVQEAEDYLLKHYGKRYSESEREWLGVLAVVIALVFIWVGLSGIIRSCR
jgi:hypothetical protein